MAMGFELAEHHRHGEAITSFVKATNLKLDDVLAHFRTGNSYYALNAIEEAQHSYERALQGDRNSPGEAGNDLLAQVIHISFRSYFSIEVLVSKVASRPLAFSTHLLGHRIRIVIM